MIISRCVFLYFMKELFEFYLKNAYIVKKEGIPKV